MCQGPTAALRPTEADEPTPNPPLAQIHPKFLHSNSTSHKWAFGAIAEMIDNAMDPDVAATQFQVDLREVRGKKCLIFMDDGGGLDADGLHKMLGFGHSEKKAVGTHTPIGHYGNGFKSGSMRLGSDVLVMSKGQTTQSVGFLSQSFLKDIQSQEVLVPMITWNLRGELLNQTRRDVQESMAAIQRYSIYEEEQELLDQLKSVPKTGTIIIISGLRKEGDEYELDGNTDEHDILLWREKDQQGQKGDLRRLEHSLQTYLVSARAAAAGRGGGGGGG